MNNNAWDIVAINTSGESKNIQIETQPGDTVVIVRKGILGRVSSELKNVSKTKKGATIVRKLGYTLADCGNLHYGPIDEALDGVSDKSLSEVIV